MPSALKALRAIRNISVAQFVSDVERTSYVNDSDEFLLDFCQKKRKLDPGLSSPSNECFNTPTINVAATTSRVQFHIQTLITTLPAVCQQMDSRV